MSDDHGSIVQFFASGHYPPETDPTARRFEDLARWLHQILPHNSQGHTALQKLLEARDCAFRAIMFK